MDPMADAVRVLIVDDHASFSESLRDVLSRRPGIVVTGTAATAADAERIADESSPDVVLRSHAGAQVVGQAIRVS
jgi:DNA-binding NarL/FixJ family response regulator